MPPLLVGLLLVQAQDVAPAALALAEHHLLGAQAGRDVGITARMGQDLVPDLLHPPDRRGQDVAPGPLGELVEIGPRIQPGVADEQDTAKPHRAQIVLDRLHRGDVGRGAREDPGAHRHAVAGDGEGDHHLRVVVPALLAVPAPAQRLEGEPAPLLAGDVLLVALEPGGGAVVEDQVDVELEQIGRAPEHRLLDGVAVLGQDVQGAVELVKAEVARLGQPHPVEPALVAGELGAGPVEALRHHGQEGGGMRRLQLLLRSSRAWIASPMPSLAQRACATCTTPSSKRPRSRCRPRSSRRGRPAPPPASSRTRRMLATSRSRAARSSRSARPKLCTTLAST